MKTLSYILRNLRDANAQARVAQSSLTSDSPSKGNNLTFAHIGIAGLLRRMVVVLCLLTVGVAEMWGM